MEQTSPQNFTNNNTAAQNAPKNHSASASTNHQGLIIALIICVVLALGGIGFGIYGVISNGNKTTEISDLKAQITEKDQTIASLKGSNSPADDDDTTPPTTEPTENSYRIYADNLAKAPARGVFGQYYHYTGSDNIEQTMLAQIDENSHLKITDLNNNDQLIAEVDDIIDVYFVQIGNGGTPYFYLISKDGKVSRICIAEGVERTIEPIDDYSEIISVTSGSDLFAWLTDINGNTYRTY